MSIASLTLRTWLRYVVPLAVLSAGAMVVVAFIALTVKLPADAVEARAQLRLGWVIASLVWIFQLWLVAAAAPAVRGLVAGAPLSQWQALARGARGLVVGAVPCGIAVLAVVLGSLALVVPGLVVLVLFAMTGASSQLGQAIPAPLVDSVAIARAHWRPIVAVVAGALVLDLALAYGLQLAILPALPKKPQLALLLPARTFVRAVCAVLIAWSAIPATAIAAVYATRAR